MTPILATSANVFPEFEPKTQISTIFLEHDKHLLLLKRCHKEDQPNIWGTPGGKIERGEEPLQTVLRELKEETQIKLAPDEVFYQGHRYARVPECDYIMHIYYAEIKERPIVLLDPKEHSEYEWISLYAFKLMPLLKSQDEVFDILYGDRIWQKINPVTSGQQVQDLATLLLCKGNRTLIFNNERRFSLNLIGTSGSGKGTQGEMLSKLFGIPTISIGDLFRDEFRTKSNLGWIIQNYDEHYYPDYLPDEVPIGMIAKRLAEEDCNQGFILDGFPRTEKQADIMRKVLLKTNDFHVPLFMNVSETDIWERLPGRSICSNCGHQVRQFDETLWPGYCPIDARKGKMIKLEQRSEDMDRKIERRLKMFRENKDEIISTMNLRDPVQTFNLNNTISPREVLHQLCDHIQICLDQLDQQKKFKITPSE